VGAGDEEAVGDLHVDGNRLSGFEAGASSYNHFLATDAAIRGPMEE
jgi:hypothetical protein